MLQCKGPDDSPTGICASGVTGNSLTVLFGGTWALRKCPSICRVVVFTGRSEAATWTAWYIVLSLRIISIFAVTWQFSSLGQWSLVNDIFTISASLLEGPLRGFLRLGHSTEQSSLVYGQ